MYASWAIGLFLYQTFDAVDGTQARRTRQSGPLGELFDHGVDACNTTLEVLLFAAAMNLGQGWKTVMTLFACMSPTLMAAVLRSNLIHHLTALLTFYVQTWDEYHTHTLTLGFISGPVEGILTLCIVYAVTAVKGGGSFWQQPLLETVGIKKYSFIPDAIYDVAWDEWYLIYGGIILIFNTIQRYVLNQSWKMLYSLKTALRTSLKLDDREVSVPVLPCLVCFPFSLPGH